MNLRPPPQHISSQSALLTQPSYHFYIIPFLIWWSKVQEKDSTDRYVLGDGPKQTVMDVDISTVVMNGCAFFNRD